MPGVQTLVPVMLDHVNAGRLSLARFVDLTSAGPQRIFGIAGKGRIAVGYDADLTIVDLKAERVIDNEWIGSKCGWTPFVGRKVKGWPVGTFVRGKRAMWEGEIVTPAVDGGLVFAAHGFEVVAMFDIDPVVVGTQVGSLQIRDFGELENLQVSKKGPADFVSKADRRAERTLRTELSKARPAFGLLMEETGAVAGRKHYLLTFGNH